MGVTIEGMTPEEMCLAMCDNVLPKSYLNACKAWYYFTFGMGQEHEGYYVKIYGTYEGTRAKMFGKYGGKWAFQYSEDDWNVLKPTEELLEVIE